MEEVVRIALPKTSLGIGHECPSGNYVTSVLTPPNSLRA
jgi:hypothetical protein